jgi:hypothetical protein
MFSLPEVLSDPAFVFGFQEIRDPSGDEPGGAGLRFANCEDLGAALREAGLQTVDVLDLFDERANLRHDMNEPIPLEWHGRYRLVVDIGSLEHVFDTRRCLESLLALVGIGGHYATHVPVNGYFAHGLHVFNPEALLAALAPNGFSLRMLRYTTASGERLEDPAQEEDVLMWLVARREREVTRFAVPQQRLWPTYYAESDPERRRALQESYWTEAGDSSQSLT